MRREARHQCESAMRNNEQENTTDAVTDGSSGRADEPKICTNCGSSIDTKEWHPLETRTDDDGNFEVYAFCDDECRDEWLDD